MMFGSPLDHQAKQITYNIYKFYKKRKLCKDTEEYKNDVNLANKVSEVTGLTPSTIKKIIKEGNSMESEYGVQALFKPKSKKTNCKKRIVVDHFAEGLIRRKAIKIGSVKKLSVILKEENIVCCSTEYIRQLLLKLGFAVNNPKGILMEKAEIVTERQRYLEAIKSFREQNRSIFYLCETKRYIRDDYTTVNIKEIPTFVIVHMNGTAGFLDESNVMLKMRPKCKEDECFEHFENYDWIKDIVLKNLPKNSVIVMNIPYCETPESMLQDEKPIAHSSKVTKEKWLKRHNIPFNETDSDSDLLELINRQDAKMEYGLSKIIKENGHEILHLPQNHCDLNPAAVMWHDVKEPALKTPAKDLFVGYPKKKWEDCLAHVKENEDEYYALISNMQIEKEDTQPTSTDNDDDDSMDSE